MSIPDAVHHGGFGSYAVRRVRPDLFTIHRPSYLECWGQIAGVARTKAEALETRARLAREARHG